MNELSLKRCLVIYGVWAGLALSVIGATLHYLHAVRAYQWNASFQRAEAAAELAHQALLRSADGSARC